MSAVLDLSESEELCTEPLPIERVRRAYDGLSPGQVLEVRSRVAEHAFMVRTWSRKQGATLRVDDRVDGVHRLVIERGAAAPTAG
ncbi:MAG: sulfurtransferase TusA family protein [Candidatus Dormibacteraeota bacterium]|nr:sulfurtransferase TusA family protein [Candidatus Dormibacteraeota bacterium]MBV9525900.1 sulfurtransferase TusA family protein [Candidatus Dormibacteraeota bacterium]